MAITAKDVSELRQRTGAGMMDCKKALEENNGDMNAAVEYLRKKGIAKAEKRADRSTSEGIVGGEIFNDGESVAEYVKAAAAKTGEAVNVKRTARFDAGESGQVGMYRHHNGKLGTLVQITASSREVAQHEATKELVKYIAEHVAASAPIAVDRSGVSAEKLESEKRVAEAQAREAGKPDAMIEKIATGKVEAFLKDVTLLPRAWVRDASITIAQLVADHAKKAGGTITVDRFARLQLGAE